MTALFSGRDQVSLPMAVALTREVHPDPGSESLRLNQAPDANRGLSHQVRAVQPPPISPRGAWPPPTPQPPPAPLQGKTHRSSMPHPQVWASSPPRIRCLVGQEGQYHWTLLASRPPPAAPLWATGPLKHRHHYYSCYFCYVIIYNPKNFRQFTVRACS